MVNPFSSDFTTPVSITAVITAGLVTFNLKNPMIATNVPFKVCFSSLRITKPAGHTEPRYNYKDMESAHGVIT